MLIENINIRNFKSLLDVKMNIGNVNVIIGPNGCGKSAFLEAIGVLSSALSEGVNFNSLLKRGVRFGTPALFKSSFNDLDRLPLTISMDIEWRDKISEWSYSINLDNPIDDPKPSWTYHSEILKKNNRKILAGSRRKREYKGIEVEKDRSLFYFARADKSLGQTDEFFKAVSNYCIYTPNTTTLRGVQTDVYQTDPVGLCGGRLPEAIQELMDIEEGMFGNLDFDDLIELLDWVDDINIGKPTKDILPSNIPSPQKTIRFTDRYMRKTKKITRNELTAYDASEGSLYVLFLLVVAMHKNGPRMFSIDNFDQALNPWLARQTTRLFCQQIIENDKICFVTTHNPLVLDGLDLTNDKIRLFTFDRNRFGHTVINRIELNPEVNIKKESLSRLWVTGRLGGVPRL